jgi:hypothetical protein
MEATTNSPNLEGSDGDLPQQQFLDPKSTLLNCKADSSTSTESDLENCAPPPPDSSHLRFVTPDDEMPSNSNRQIDPRQPGYRPGAGKAPRSRMTLTDTPEPSAGGAVDEPAASTAVSSGGGKDVSLYQAMSSGSNTNRRTTATANRYQARIEDSDDEYTVPATSARPGAGAAGVNTSAAQGSVIKNRSAGTPAARAPAAMVGGSRRVTKKRSGANDRTPAARTPAAAAARTASPVFRDTTTPERFVRPPPGAYAVAPSAVAPANDEPLTGAAREAAIGELAEVQRQMREAEARLAASRAREAELDEQIAARLNHGSTRWTRREGVRASRRGAAGDITDWGHQFEEVMRGMGGIEEEARRARERRGEEDRVAALGDRELTSLRQRLEEQERRELEKRLADFTPEELELLRRSYEEEEDE